MHYGFNLVKGLSQLCSYKSYSFTKRVSPYKCHNITSNGSINQLCFTNIGNKFFAKFKITKKNMILQVGLYSKINTNLNRYNLIHIKALTCEGTCLSVFHLKIKNQLKIYF